MTWEEYRRALEALDLSVDDCAAFFATSRSTAYRWANGSSSVPYPVAMWLRFMEREPMSPWYVQQVLQTPPAMRRTRRKGLLTRLPRSDKDSRRRAPE